MKSAFYWHPQFSTVKPLVNPAFQRDQKATPRSGSWQSSAALGRWEGLKCLKGRGCQPTLRSDENARRSLQCSDIFSSGPRPLTVLRDIQVCCWIISKLACSIFSSECQCFQHILQARLTTNKACIHSIYMCCCRCSLRVQEKNC